MGQHRHRHLHPIPRPVERSPRNRLAVLDAGLAQRLVHRLEHAMVLVRRLQPSKVLRQRRDRIHLGPTLRHQRHPYHLGLDLHRLLHRRRRLLRPLHLLDRGRQQRVRDHDLARRAGRRRAHLLYRLAGRDPDYCRQYVEALLWPQWRYYGLFVCG